MAKNFVKGLTGIVGSENILYSRRDLLAYAYDATQRQEVPQFVLFPRSTDEISRVMKLAYREKVPVVPRGAGTGISGGTIPVKGGIVLELSRMNRIIALDTANHRAVVEPGVVNLDLQDALAPLGFMYPPDPASQKSCTLGGNIGENAGGPLCFRYGVTSKYVCGMQVVLPDGEVVEFGGDVEDVPGYDFRGLLIGSEGILGIATRLVLHIVPLPEASRTMLAVFDNLEDAGQAVSDMISAGIVPAALELMDRRMCWAIEQSVHAGYPTDADGVLLIEIAGLADGLDRQAGDISEICRRNNVRELRSAETKAERDILWKGRKGAFGSVARICPPYLVNDGTVPRNMLVQALRKVQAISENYHVQIANVAHAGDGNLHPLVLYDRDNPQECMSARKTSEEILDTCLALGGTISGEHGVGLEKMAAMLRMFALADLAFMRSVKQVFDPENILNPGKLLPDEPGPVAQQTAPKTAAQDFHHMLGEILGAGNLIADDDVTSSYQVDGLMPEAVGFASTMEQVSGIIRAGNLYRKAIIPWGGGSKQESGPCLSAVNTVLCLKKMNRIIDLDTGNFTVRVETGKINSDLQRELAEHKLFFPLETPFAETSTIGGELAANESGPGRFKYGTARDLVLGMTVVTPSGDIIRPGGKTMKNVAGLDLGKMFIGSWGTLGVITEAVLRLFPLPEAGRSMCLVFPDVERASVVTGRILNSVLLPAAMELMNGMAVSRMGSSSLPSLKEVEVVLLVDVEGSIEEVERHLKEITTLAEGNGVSFMNTFDGEKANALWNDYRRLHRVFLNGIPASFKCKASLPISKTGDMFKAMGEIAGKHKIEASINAHCGNGIVYAFVSAEKEKVFNVIDELKHSAAGLGGLSTIEAAPLWVRKTPGVHLVPATHELMKRFKQAFDPNNILNPGKVGGY